MTKRCHSHGNQCVCLCDDENIFFCLTFFFYVNFLFLIPLFLNRESIKFTTQKKPVHNIGLPLFRASGWPGYNSLRDLLNPRSSLPRSAITRDPFWYDLDDLRPFSPRIPSNHLPSYLRDSYLSPIKRNYLWNKHPVRPFGKYQLAVAKQTDCNPIFKILKIDKLIAYISFDSIFYRIRRSSHLIYNSYTKLKKKIKKHF